MMPGTCDAALQALLAAGDARTALALSDGGVALLASVAAGSSRRSADADGGKEAYGDEKVANRDIRVLHGATEKGP
jgi:hypothetical protein